MKIIIIEGPDNTGKSTLIEGICKYYNYDNITIRHFGKPPKHLSPQDSLSFQFRCFDNEAYLINEMNKMFRDKYQYYDNIIIWNRSHLGEFVYSQMFRQGDPNSIKEKLLIWEEFMLLTDEYPIHLITTIAEPEFLLNNEDGNSLSQTLEQKSKEIELFKQAHEFSLISHKLLLSVDKDKKFKSKEEILRNILSFINHE